MDLKCKCGAGPDAQDAVLRSATPGIGLDHIIIECEKCGARAEYFGADAVAADKAVLASNAAKTNKEK